MAVVTRAIGPPWNIHSDHQDALTVRDAGWIIGFASSVEEAFDMTLQAYRVGEDRRVLLPVIVALDGFTLSHASEPVRLSEESEVREWLPPREPLPFKPEPGSHFSVGNLGPDKVTMELRWYVWRAMERAKHVIREVSVDYAGRFDGSTHSLVEEFKTGDARYLVVLAGAWSGDAMEAADMLRDEGYPVGVARLRYIRPFLAE
jgi:pyruvate ferredoxin oxidoreductase alpha subunit